MSCTPFLWTAQQAPGKPGAKGAMPSRAWKLPQGYFVRGANDD